MKRVVVVACVIVGACVPDLLPPPAAQLSCRAAGDCPGPLLCDARAGRCLDPDGGCVTVVDDVATGSADGVACVLGESEAAAHCLAGRCTEARCGDGVVDAVLGERCDFGEANSDVAAGACRTDCSLARCGDGVVDPGEGCDGDSNTCRSCLSLCVDGAGDCDDVVGCECRLEIIEAEAGIFTALAADEGGVWLAVDGDQGTRIERHPTVGESTTLATFAGWVSQLLVTDDALYVREVERSANPFPVPIESVWSRVDTQTGAVTVLLHSFSSIAIRGDEVAFVDEADSVRRLFRGSLRAPESALPLGDVSCFAPRAEVSGDCRIAFRGDDIVLLDDAGDLFVSVGGFRRDDAGNVVATDGGALVRLVDVANGSAMIVDGDDVYWISLGLLMRKRGASAPEVIAAGGNETSFSELHVARPLVFTTTFGSGFSVVSVDVDTGAVVSRGDEGGAFAGVGDDVHWMVPFASTTASHLRLVR